MRFVNSVIEKCTFLKSKYPFDITRVYNEKIVVFNKFSCGKNSFKYIIELRCDDKIISLYETSTDEKICKKFW